MDPVQPPLAPSLSVTHQPLRAWPLKARLCHTPSTLKCSHCSPNSGDHQTCTQTAHRSVQAGPANNTAAKVPQEQADARRRARFSMDTTGRKSISARLLRIAYPLRAALTAADACHRRKGTRPPQPKLGWPLPLWRMPEFSG